MFKKFFPLFFIFTVIAVVSIFTLSHMPQTPGESRSAKISIKPGGLEERAHGNKLSPPHGKSDLLSTPHLSNKVATIDDQKKIGTLKQILASKNDNDPRLDTDFKDLSEGAKTLMRDQYKSFEAERFNEKGTVIFLLGRNLSTPEDFDFLADVLSEPPCQSMTDCRRPTRGGHPEPVNQITLAYPQIVSLKAIESYLSSGNRIPPELKQQALRNLAVAAASKNLTVARMARSFSRKFKGLDN